MISSGRRGKRKQKKDWRTIKDIAAIVAAI